MIAFADYFTALNGYPPFPWQSRLADTLLSTGWPPALALPTSAGKTASIDIALFALAMQADATNRTMPRRIIWMVDRRVIVDEAFERAQFIAEKLQHADDGPVRTVADRLRLLGGSKSPLACHRLRGGAYRDEAWAKTPTQPTVICSTVDQIGSRLLFRGYGVGPGSLAVQAGLAANDALLVLDEAHVSEPMRQTLEAVCSFRQRHQHYSPFAFVVVSATPPPGITSVFRADAADKEHPVLGRRIRARKPTQLVATSNLVNELVSQAKRIRKEGASAVAVMVNRVATARQVHEKLAGSILLTGRMRDVDRDAIVGEWLPKLRADGTEPPEVFVVATQTLEVGANLDFDGLVTECASLDALRQRFGRLNRLGRLDQSPAAIVVSERDLRAKQPDPIYGESLIATWHWLNRHAVNDSLDMGVASIENLLAEDASQTANLSSPRADAPVMLPSHLDTWVQTFPTPAIVPDVSLWLHGKDRASPEVQVLWRADLELGRAERWVQTVSLLPPSTAEFLPVRLSVFRRWLSEQTAEDTEDMLVPDLGGDRELQSRTPFVIWRGPDSSEVTSSSAAIKPGDVIVLPEVAGGWNVLGCIPDSPMVDRAETGYLARHRQPILRLARPLLLGWPDARPIQALLEAEDFEIEDVRSALSESTPPPWLDEIVTALAEDRGVKLTSHPAGIVVVGRQKAEPISDTMTSEDDTASSASFVSLDKHSEGVAEFAEEYARKCGLPEPLVNDIVRAASFHDMGKADPRFQAWLQGGVRLTDTILAKSGQDASTMKASRVRSGYPPGARHELLSVRILLDEPTLLEGAHDRDLVLHLVAAHHGRCRPFAPISSDTSPVEVRLRWKDVEIQVASDHKLDSVGSGVADRFWSLVRRYGWWGLAFLESILVLADRRRSEWEARQ